MIRHRLVQHVGSGAPVTPHARYLRLMARLCRMLRRRMAYVKDPWNVPRVRAPGICHVGIMERRGRFAAEAS